MIDVKAALELRDEILSAAPDAYKTDDEIEKWAAALLLAKSYSNVAQEDTTTSNENADLCVEYFMQNYCVQYISEILLMPMTNVVQCLNDAGIPAVVDNSDMNIEKIHAALTGDELPGRFYGATKKVQQINSKLHYTPRPLVPAATMQYSVIGPMVMHGYSYGDIAKYANCPISSILRTSKKDLSELEVQLYLKVLDDWMCGKSIIFISVKHSMALSETRRILNACEYALIEGIDCNIHSVNNSITGNKRVSYQRGTYKDELYREYLTNTFKTDSEDTQVINQLRGSGYPDNKIAFARGCVL